MFSSLRQVNLEFSLNTDVTNQPQMPASDFFMSA